MRGLECELSPLEKPDGSCVFMQGDTKVICGVYGPTEVKINREIIEKSTLECIVKPKSSQPGCREKALEAILTKTCEEVALVTMHPRSAIQIVFQIVQDSGSMLSCLINGASMAMLNAGLPMKCMLVAVTCAIDKQDDFLIDPTTEQESEARCTMTYAFDSRSYNMISSYTTGTFSTEDLFKSMELCRLAAESVSLFQRSSVERYLSKEMNEGEADDVDDDELIDDS